MLTVGMIPKLYAANVAILANNCDQAFDSGEQTISSFLDETGVAYDCLGLQNLTEGPLDFTQYEVMYCRNYQSFWNVETNTQYLEALTNAVQGGTFLSLEKGCGSIIYFMGLGFSSDVGVTLDVAYESYIVASDANDPITGNLPQWSAADIGNDANNQEQLIAKVIPDEGGPGDIPSFMDDYIFLAHR